MKQTQNPKKFWKFSNLGATKTPELEIYGEITDFPWYDSDVSACGFVEELSALGDVEEITVRINSGGGDVASAIAIASRLRDHPAKINVKIDGIAASAATIIAMAGDSRAIAENGLFMVHDPSTYIYGHVDKDELEKASRMLETVQESIANSYVEATGKSKEEILEIMSAETWYTGEEAVAEGFCDQLLFSPVTMLENKGYRVINSVSINPEDYKNFPKSTSNTSLLRQAPPQENETEVPDLTNNTNKKEVEEVVIKNESDLKKQYPDLINTMMEKAKAEERERIQGIEEIAGAGYETMAKAAKFEKFQNASDFAVAVLKEQRKQGGLFLENREKDVAEGKVGQEGSAQNQTEAETDENETICCSPFCEKISFLRPFYFFRLLLF